jgi:peptide/nickel transport system permease protein
MSIAPIIAWIVDGKKRPLVSRTIPPAARKSCLPIWLRGDKLSLLAVIIFAVLLVVAFVGPSIVPDPYNLESLNLQDAMMPPLGVQGGAWPHLLGTDNQGRDIACAIVFGMRSSMVIAFTAVLLAVGIGVSAGLLAASFGGWIDAMIMRVADAQLTFPPLLIALIVDGILHSVLKGSTSVFLSGAVVVSAIALSGWVQYARTTRTCAVVERAKDYVAAASISGTSALRTTLSHVVPNISAPLFVLAMVHIASAIIVEATLSFLGMGLPATSPTLGTLIRIGNDYVFSGQWWIAAFPGIALVLIVFSTNVIGDRIQSLLNPEESA